ncbi:NUDIX domain-containing protein [Neisseria leonii]|uniref:8-oxo-dGTP diphosphatase n=1 Tax=Neisseria leonii TaxID=2995413 RepID=A0A9X4E0T7_9NEIS|nr:NUDIX domain-containing protein [Neisseria sp. 51.81]MDD9327321.1 NUDIX domain-containing protein [Neisseria sp. 51.81]
MTERKCLHVVAGVLFNEAGECLLSSRPQGKPYAGYWEFAGGKVEADETELAALRREFAEELGITVHGARLWLTKIHDYEHARVYLRFYRIAAGQWSGAPEGKEGQQWRWQRAGDYTVEPMLPANSALLKALAVPQALTGRLKTGFGGENAQGRYWIAPYPGEAHHSGVWLTAAQLAGLGRMPQAQSVWVLAGSAEEMVQTADADGWIWRVSGGASAAALADVLAAGVPQPLIVAASAEDCRRWGRAWLDAGAHALLADDETERA